MTSWRIVICLFLFVSLIQICQGDGCNSVYFKMDHFGEYPKAKFALVKGTNLKDMVECTYERQCLKTRKDINISHIIPILQCCGRTNDSETGCTKTPKCQDLKSERNISYYNLLCLAAIALNGSTRAPDSIDCEYSELIYFIGNSPKADQKTKQPTPFTTQPERTTAAPTVMQPEPPTATVQPSTTQPERTTAAPTVMQPETPTTTVQPTTTQSERTTAASAVMQPEPTKTSTSGQKDLQMGNGTSRSEMCETGMNLLMAAGLGLMLAILPALFVYFYMRQQRRRDLMQDSFIVRNGEDPNLMSETQSSTPMPTANGGGVEARLLQAEDCHTVVTDSAL
ncbi:uncharacterized protein LOC117831873 [Notolabrus celidotus]|uniref:uncharacterized protein LOC117831873 n=1 Tax=Notolabrus celidotus TaxID=1203425 RepID=UPI00149064A2|nr:uncharacterized protein LOC117831873 [Notolabrus celidotus]